MLQNKFHFLRTIEYNSELIDTYNCLSGYLDIFPLISLSDIMFTVYMLF